MPRRLDCARISLADVLLAAGALLATACQGEIVSTPGPDGSPAPGSPGTGSGGGKGGGTGGGTGGGSTTPGVFSPAPGAFKRLTTSEYLASLRDLLGEVSVGDLEPDTFLEGFAKVGSAEVSISLNGVEKYELAAEAATQQVFGDAARRGAFIGCTPSGVSDSACFGSFVSRFGRLAFRRPLSEAERQSYTALAGSIATTLSDPLAGLRLTTKALLLSPNFLYRLERGAPDTSSGFWRLTSHELASSLAYFLTNTTPDSALLDAAERDELSSVEGLRSQAQRLLAGSRGRESVANFATELFRLALVESRAKDPGLFPNYTPSLQAAMARELPAMFQSVVFDRRASALELFTTRRTFVNADLARLYGLDASGLTSSSWQPVELPAGGLRAGLLGTGAFLSLNANQKEGSPTHRGKFIRQLLMCQKIPDPPPDVSTVIEDPPPGVVLTKRDKLTAHRESPVCAGCHELMDPMGLTLENFDAIGAFRDTDHGLPIDVSGDFDGVAFNGPIELGNLLAQSPLTAECLVKNLYRYATGRPENAGEEPVVADLVERFAAGGHDLQNLMLDLVTSDGFRFVAPPQ
jgi:hypothetical protein